MEARGNDPSYPAQGRDYITSALNWGPSVALNSFSLTRGWFHQKRVTYDESFHTFAVEWDEDYMWMYLDSRVQRVLDLRFNSQSFFERGDFPVVVQNGSQEVVLEDPWAGRPNVAPFDQSFYLIMNVAVGGTSGWFEDGVGGKPWYDQSASAMRDFAMAQDTWYKTWATDPRQRALAVDYVRMYQKC